MNAFALCESFFARSNRNCSTAAVSKVGQSADGDLSFENCYNPRGRRSAHYYHSPISYQNGHDPRDNWENENLWDELCRACVSEGRRIDGPKSPRDTLTARRGGARTA